MQFITNGHTRSQLNSGGEETFDLADHADDFFLVRQSDHEELVALVEADHAVSKKPDAVQDWVAAQQPTDRRASDRTRLKDLGPHRRARSATERAQ